MKERLTKKLENASMGMIKNNASHIFFGETKIPDEMLWELKTENQRKKIK